MKSILNLFKSQIGMCNLCRRAIYSGDCYGYENDRDELSITGYFEYYFCKKCVERNCAISSIENKIGEKLIINQINGMRSRIMIRE